MENGKTFSAKQFILLQLTGGGHSALASLSNPTEAPCISHVNKNWKFGSKISPALQGAYETHQPHAQLEACK